MSEPTDDSPRPGEKVCQTPLARDATLAFVGHIESPWRTRSACPRQGDRIAGPLCQIVVSAQWQAALDGLDEHQELQLLYWMHEARRDLLRLVPAGGKPRGPFALRAPTRPNPIASSIVSLVGRNGAVITVRGLDCVDGTPLLDIKPWRGVNR